MIDTILIGILVLTCVWGVLKELGKPDGVCQFPFWASITFLLFVVPQLAGLRHDFTLPPTGLAKTTIMSVLCLTAIHAGHAFRPRPFRYLCVDMYRWRIVACSGLLSVLGAVFFLLIRDLPSDLTSTSQWSGLPVAYLFLANMWDCGFALSVMLYANRVSKWTTYLVAVGSGYFLYRIVVSGRRGSAVEYLFIVLIGVWARRGKQFHFPRTILALGIFLGTLAHYSIGQYRSGVMISGNSPVRAAKETFLLENVISVFEEGGLELRNAVFMIDATDRTRNFDFGAFHWNALVFNFIPRQIIGEDNKEALMLNVASAVKVSSAFYGYEPTTGSTFTGMVDCFSSFWYFGCLKFFLIAWLLRRLFESARLGFVRAQVVYALLLSPGLQTITHWTQFFFSGWIHISLFLVPCWSFARIRSGRHDS